MTQMTQKLLYPLSHLRLLLGHPPKIHDPIMTQMTQKMTQNLMPYYFNQDCKLFSCKAVLRNVISNRGKQKLYEKG